MSVEYDLVVIGSTPAGIYAAIAASHLQARVAFVALVSTLFPGDQGLATAPDWARANRILGQVCHARYRCTTWEAEYELERDSRAVGFAAALQRAEAVVATLQEQSAPAVLASLGIELVDGMGEFTRQPLALTVKGRELRSRAYLIATGCQPVTPAIDGLPAKFCSTPQTLWQPELQSSLPKNLMIVGGGLTATELAQIYVRSGSHVHLITHHPRILIAEDAEAAWLVQAQLEAEGVQVLTQAQITQVKTIQDKPWVQVGNQAIATDAILFANRQAPDVAGLNLEAAGVKWHEQGISVNRKLQTTNPRIYACGDVLGGYSLPHLAQYEAAIAVKNALFWPIFQVDYQGVPWAIFTDPQLARVGLTEAQAQQRYGNEAGVVRQYFKSLDKAQAQGPTTGFCKLILHRNGTILGAHIVGSGSAELIHPIALAIRQKLGIKAIAALPFISPTLSEIIARTVTEWHQERLDQNRPLKDFLEGFFSLRRSWSS